MSKLKFLAICIFSLLIVGIIYFSSSSQHSEWSVHEHTRQTSESGHEIWGKSRGPVLVKIEEVQKTKKIITLKGLIRSQYPHLQVEWKLPDGAVLINGQLKKELHKNEDNTFSFDTLTVDVSQAKEEPIVFMAYVEINGERFGHTRVYKWTTSEEEQELVEKIKTHMKSSKSHFVR